MIRWLLMLFLLVTLMTTPSFAQQTKSGQVAGWGDFVNPRKDCKVQPLEKSLKLTLPAVAHDLSIEINRMNAPRILQPAKGDFTVQVKVSGVAHPQNVSVIPGRKPFCSAGLLVWRDERNYIRLERATLNTGASTSTYASWELRQNGQFARAGRTDELPLTGDDTWLRITRQGSSYTGAASRDGLDWSPLPALTLDGADVRVGIVAINDTPTPFTPVYSELDLTASP